MDKLDFQKKAEEMAHWIVGLRQNSCGCKDYERYGLHVHVFVGDEEGENKTAKLYPIPIGKLCKSMDGIDFRRFKKKEAEKK